MGITGAGLRIRVSACQQTPVQWCLSVTCPRSRVGLSVRFSPTGTSDVEREDDSTSWGSHLLEDARVHDGPLRPPRVPGAGARVAVLVTAARGSPTHYRHQANASARSHDEGRFWWRLLLLASCEPRDDSVFPAGTKRVRQLGNERASLTRPSLVMKGSPVRVRASAYNKVPAESLSLQRPAQSARPPHG